MGMNAIPHLESTIATITTGSTTKAALERQKGTEGAAHVVEVGLPSQRHNRFRDNITATWPGDDTFSVTFTTTEDVRRYRVLVTGGADGDYVKVTEDATNEAQAEAWLANPTASSTVDVEHFRVYSSTPDVAGSFIPLWSEWKELSKNTSDLSLSRLDFLASAAGPFVVFVEAE